MAEPALTRAEESVATRFTRGMNAATSKWGVLTDFTVASALAAIPIVLIVKQIGGDELRSPTTAVLVVIALLPVVAAVVTSFVLRGARADVVRWIAAQPFPVENVNALLVGLTDTFEITFAEGVEMPSRMDVQRRLDPISDDILATEMVESERRVEVKIGVVESTRVPLRSTFHRWERFRRIVEEVLVPLSRDKTIVSVRLV
jgi:hypothetical protein